MKHFVYILQGRDGTLYTGVTKDLKIRLKRHNRGRGGRFTRGRRPLKLVYFEEFSNLRSAMQREMQIKKLSRSYKQELIEIKRGQATFL